MKNLIILIYLKSRENTKGERQIYLRLTVNGKRKETSLNRSILAKRSDNHKQCGKWKSEEILVLNKYLNSVTESFYRNHQEMIYNNEEVTSQALMNRYLGFGEKVKNIIEVIKEFNSRTKRFVSDGTYRKYIALLNHVKEFLIFQYKVSDLNMKKINYQFVEDFDFYLRTEKSV